jgi:hypothetical protein
MSQFHYLSDAEITNVISDNAQSLRACQLDSTSTFLVLTISEESEYCKPTALKKMLGNLWAVGMVPRLYKAAGSNDIQIFIAFSEVVKTEEMAKAISVYLEKCGFETTSGVLTIHSSQPFAIPLQKGFCWLNDSFEPKLRRDEVSLPAALAVFLRDLDTAAVSPVTLESNLNRAVKTIDEIQGFTTDESSNSDSDSMDIESVAEEIDQISPIVLEEKVALRSKTALLSEPTLLSATAETEPEAFHATEVQFTDKTVGMQLLLFPIDVTPEISALPKGRPKRGKRPRSNLPDGSQLTGVPQTEFSPTEQPGILAQSLFDKEVFEKH